MARMAVLGGEEGHRTLLGGGRSRFANRLLIAELATALVWSALVNPIAGPLLGVVIVGATWRLVSQPADGSPTSGQRVVGQVVYRHRRRPSQASFIPSWLAEEPDAGDARTVGYVAQTPRAVGEIGWLSVPTGGGSVMAAQSHHNPGEAPYLAFVVEIPGQRVTISSDTKYDVVSEQFGSMVLGRLAVKRSLIRGFQTIARVVPAGMYRHDEWLAANMAPVEDLPRALVDSYDYLTSQARLDVATQRHFVVAKVPHTDRLQEALAATGLRGLEAIGEVLRVEAQRLVAILASAGMGPARVLGPMRVAAILRHLQNPSFDMDAHGDVDERTCWRPTTSARGHVVVDDEWFSRVGRIRAIDISPQPISVRFLSPLLTDSSADVVRTVSVHHTLVPQSQARAAAVADLTLDRANSQTRREQGTVSDGRDEQLETASSTRLTDLAPGSSSHGDYWSMWVTVSARSERALRLAVEDLEEKASEAGITNVQWVDDLWPGRHDDALVTCLPLARANRMVKA